MSGAPRAPGGAGPSAGARVARPRGAHRRVTRPGAALDSGRPAADDAPIGLSSPASARVQRVIITILGVVLALFGTRFARGHDETGKATAEASQIARLLPTSSGAPPAGLWRVQGLDLSSKGFGDGGRGDLKREWLISKRCAPACGLWLARTTSVGVQRARLTARAGRLFATFERRTEGCGTSRTGRQRQAFTLSVDPDRHHIRALEVNRATFPDCRRNGVLGRADQSAVSRTLWFATLDCDQERCRTTISSVGPAGPDTADLREARRTGLVACRNSGRSAAQCRCTLHRVLAWTAPPVVGVLMGALDRSQHVDRLTAARVRRDARACA